jgi:hypothetical protein
MSTENDSPEIHVVRIQELGHDGKFYTREKTTQEEYSFYLSAATNGSQLAGTIPTGKKFRVRTIVANNQEITRVLFTLTNGSGLTYTKAQIKVASSTSKELTNIQGLVFDDDIYMLLTTFATGTNIFIGGELDPDEDAA